MTVTVRDAGRDDVDIILDFINRAADFHARDFGLTSSVGLVEATAERIAETLFGAHSFAHIVIAEMEQEGKSTPVGFAAYYFTYSSYKAQPSLYVEDVFVDASVRRAGVGTRLMRRLAEVAVAHDCRSMDWVTALADDNAAIPFYRDHIRAEVLGPTPDGKFVRMRLDSDAARRCLGTDRSCRSPVEKT